MCKDTFLIRNPRAGLRGQREFIPVPCGKCPRCVSSRISQWVFRMEQELKCSCSPFFVTLTYDRKHVPRMAEDIPLDERMAGVEPRVFKVLDPRHLTLYFKLLRKRTGEPIRYFAVGEYGSKRKRPHYHIVLLNCTDIRAIQDCWAEHLGNSKFERRGHVDVRPLDDANSVVYCLKYLYKRDSYRPLGVAPFTRMSKGLGRNYISPEVVKFHNSDLEKCTVSLNNGSIIPLPKYMKDKIYDSFQRYRLGLYLQDMVDKKAAKRVAKIVADTGKDENKVLHELYMEPFLDTFGKSRIVKPTVF